VMNFCLFCVNNAIKIMLEYYFILPIQMEHNIFIICFIFSYIFCVIRKVTQSIFFIRNTLLRQAQGKKRSKHTYCRDCWLLIKFSNGSHVF
jgi:hypothetical protein